MIETPQIRPSDDGSLCLSQGAAVERIVCLVLGTAAFAGFIALTIEGLPPNAADTMAFVSALGFLLGALIFPSSEVRLDARSQRLFYRRDQCGIKREREHDFAEIEALRRVDRYETGKLGLQPRFFLRVRGQELPLFPNALSLDQADELEARLHSLLPRCPVETSSQLEVELPPLLGSVDGNLQFSPEGVLIVRKDALSGRIALICCGIGFFSVEFWLVEGLEPFQVFGFLFMGALFVLGSLVLDSFEFQFDPGTRRLLLTEEVGGFGRQRTFEFSSIQAMRRESWTIEEDDAPLRERFHLFLQIGDEEVMLSPKELSRDQVDELQNAVKSVLGAPPLLTSNTNN